MEDGGVAYMTCLVCGEKFRPRKNRSLPSKALISFAVRRCFSLPAEKVSSLLQKLQDEVGDPSSWNVSFCATHHSLISKAKEKTAEIKRLRSELKGLKTQLQKGFHRNNNRALLLIQAQMMGQSGSGRKKKRTRGPEGWTTSFVERKIEQDEEDLEIVYENERTAGDSDSAEAQVPGDPLIQEESSNSSLSDDDEAKPDVEDNHEVRSKGTNVVNEGAQPVKPETDSDSDSSSASNSSSSQFEQRRQREESRNFVRFRSPGIQPRQECHSGSSTGRRQTEAFSGRRIVESEPSTSRRDSSGKACGRNAREEEPTRGSGMSGVYMQQQRRTSSTSTFRMSHSTWTPADTDTERDLQKLKDKTCPDCGKVFSSSFSMKRHRSKKHLLLTPPPKFPSGIRKKKTTLNHPCNICHKKLKTQDELKNHMRWNHADQLRNFYQPQTSAPGGYSSGGGRGGRPSNVLSSILPPFSDSSGNDQRLKNPLYPTFPNSTSDRQGHGHNVVRDYARNRSQNQNPYRLDRRPNNSRFADSHPGGFHATQPTLPRNINFQKYTCIICDKVFPTVSLLKNHERHYCNPF